jgi:hypothetical protein
MGCWRLEYWNLDVYGTALILLPCGLCPPRVRIACVTYLPAKKKKTSSNEAVKAVRVVHGGVTSIIISVATP